MGASQGHKPATTATIASARFTLFLSSTKLAPFWFIGLRNIPCITKQIDDRRDEANRIGYTVLAASKRSCNWLAQLEAPFGLRTALAEPELRRSNTHKSLEGARELGVVGKTKTVGNLAQSPPPTQ